MVGLWVTVLKHYFSDISVSTPPLLSGICLQDLLFLKGALLISSGKSVTSG